MLKLLDGNESFVEAEAKLCAFDKHQAWSLELPRHAHGSTSKAEESPETKRSSITSKQTPETTFGGSAKAFGSAVAAAIAKDYMESHPGPENSGSDTGIHGAAKLCISDKKEEPRGLLWLLHCLHYRSRLMDLADIYAVQISPSSKIPNCAEWDPASVYNLNENDTIQYNELKSRLDKLQLFPSPNDQQSPSWIKPVGYLAVTIILSGFGGEVVEQKIGIICHSAEQVKDEIFDHLLRVLITRSKRQRVGELLGRKIRKTGMRDTHAGVAMYLPYSASFYYY